MNRQDRKSIISLALWGLGGLAMIIAGICIFIKGYDISSKISALLGIAALITGGVTLRARVYERKNGVTFRFDFVIWLLLGILLLTTNILSALGGIIFVLIGLGLIISGLGSARSAVSSDRKKPVKLVFACIFIIAGAFMILNAAAIFDLVVSKAIAIYFVVHGAYLLYDWLGQVRYFRNFRGVEK